MLYDQLPSDAPDLYHYSTSAGLLGIINYKQLWLSHVNFLNDAQEYSYGINLIQRVLNENYDKIFELPSYYTTYQSTGLSPTFSMSLTEEGDLLSQWRGYCSSGGYSFAFDKQQLNAMLLAVNKNSEPQRTLLRVGKCIYNEDEQIAYIKKALEGLLSPERQQYFLTLKKKIALDDQLRELRMKQYTEALSSSEEEKKLAMEHELASSEFNNMPPDRSLGRELMPYHDHFRQLIPEIVTLFKHPSFREEKEWRIVYRDPFLFNEPPLSDARVEFREGKSTLIPYVKFPLATNDDRVRITKTFVSPGPQQELAKIACEAFLQRYSSYNVAVKNSEIPYRNW